MASQQPWIHESGSIQDERSGLVSWIKQEYTNGIETHHKIGYQSKLDWYGKVLVGDMLYPNKKKVVQ